MAEAGERPPASAVGVASGMEVFVALSEEVDLDKLKETLARRVAKLEQGVAGTEGKLKNKGFVERADPDVVQAEALSF